MPVSSETTKSGLQPKFPSLNKNADLYKSAFFLPNLVSSQNIFFDWRFLQFGLFFLKTARKYGLSKRRQPAPRYVRKKMDKNAECDNKIRKSAPQ